MTQIRVTAVMAIKPGRLAEFKDAVSKLNEITKDEPATQIYEYFATSDGTKVILHEHYDNSEGMLAHFANVGELAASTMELFDLERLDLCGEPSAELENLLSSLDQSALTIYKPLA